MNKLLILIILSFFIWNSQSINAQNLDLDFINTIEDTSPSTPVHYSMQIQDEVISFRFKLLITNEVNYGCTEWEEIIISIKDYDGRIWILKKGFEKVDLREVEGAYEYIGKLHDLGPIYGIQLENKTIEIYSEENKDDFKALKKARRIVF